MRDDNRLDDLPLPGLNLQICTTNYVTTVGVHISCSAAPPHPPHIRPRSHPAPHPAGSPAALPQPAALPRSIPPSIRRQPRILASLASSGGPTILASSFCLSLTPPIAEHRGEPRLPSSPLPPLLPLPRMPPPLLSSATATVPLAPVRSRSGVVARL
jgi:hypothetical protein